MGTNMNDINVKDIDLLLTHGYIITMNQKRQIFEDGSIAIKDGEIAVIGRTDELINKINSKKVKDLKGALVHPGLIDAHQHITMFLVRGWAPDYYTFDGPYFELFEKPFFENRTIEDEFYGTVLACMEMVLNGTTTFGDTGTATDIDRIMEAIKMVGLKGRFGYGISDNMIGVLDMLNYSTEECLKKLEYQISKYPTNQNTQVGCWVGMRGMGICSDKLLKGAKKLADSYDTTLIMHQSCYKNEVRKYIKKLGGKRPIEHLYDLGILGPKTTLVHMIYLDPKEIEILAETGTGIVHCPGASTRNAMSSSIYGSFPEMVEEEIPIALGSDQGNSSDGLDICRMAYLAAIIHKEARRTLPAISAETAFEMATINGAKVMGMDNNIGSLELGKKADIVIHNLNHPGSHPPFDPLNNLIFSIQSKSIDTVLIDGKTIVENGKLTTLDEQEIYKKIDAKAFDLSKRMNYKVKRTWPIIK